MYHRGYQPFALVIAKYCKESCINKNITVHVPELWINKDIPKQCNYSNNYNCYLCGTALYNNVLHLHCGHYFHKHCLRLNLFHALHCPICYKKFTFKDVYNIIKKE